MNKEKQYQKQYREKNKKRLASNNKEWCKNNPDKVKLIKQRYGEKRKIQRQKIKQEKENNKYF